VSRDFEIAALKNDNCLVIPLFGAVLSGEIMKWINNGPDFGFLPIYSKVWFSTPRQARLPGLLRLK
jgi:hypothetical protein